MSESVTAPPVRRQAGRPAYVEWLAGAGAVLLLSALALFVSELSRAVGVVLAVVGAAAVLSAFAVRRRGSWPSRLWLVAAATPLVALAGYGIWLLIYVLTRQDVGV